jgi:hypothetical protein
VADRRGRQPSSRHGPDQARALRNRNGRAPPERAPDNLASLFGYFDRPMQHLRASLADIAADGPGVPRAMSLPGIPVLVIGNS